MLPPAPHRKTVRHFDEAGHAHELTFSCYQRRPLLADDERCRLLSRSIDAAVEKQGFSLVAFVYMPEHVHLDVFPVRADAAVSTLLYAIKRPHSFRVKQLLLERGDPLLQELTVRERPGKDVFRFWQEGGGYDRNITSHPALITSAEYFHENPVRRGLCQTAEDWKWSSWRHYHRPDLPPDPDLPIVHGFPES